MQSHSADNRYRLNHLFDPANMPAFDGLKMRLKRVLVKTNIRKPSDIPLPHRYTIREFDNLLASVHLKKIDSCTLGFGLFSLFKLKLFSEPAGVKLHGTLQRYADFGFPILRDTGTQYIVVATHEKD